MKDQNAIMNRFKEKRVILKSLFFYAIKGTKGDFRCGVLWWRYAVQYKYVECKFNKDGLKWTFGLCLRIFCLLE